MNTMKMTWSEYQAHTQNTNINWKFSKLFSLFICFFVFLACNRAPAYIKNKYTKIPIYLFTYFTVRAVVVSVSFLGLCARLCTLSHANCIVFHVKLRCWYTFCMTRKSWCTPWNSWHGINMHSHTFLSIVCQLTNSWWTPPVYATLLLSTTFK